MKIRSVLLYGLLLCGCNESADEAGKVQEENRRQFDSINADGKASGKTASGSADVAREVLDSFLNNTEDGKAIKKNVQHEQDSIMEQQQREMSSRH